MKTLIYGTDTRHQPDAREIKGTAPETKRVDANDLYKELHDTIRANEPAVVETEFTSMSDVPKEFRDLFQLDPVASAAWVDASTGKFVPNAKIPEPTKLKLGTVLALAVGGVGAAVGGLAAGPIGIAVGGVVGAGVGAFAGAASSDKATVHIEISAQGKLIIRIEPK